MIEIPVRTDIGWWSEVVDLGDTLYKLEFAWNTRDERWYMSISLTDGTVLLAGLPIVVDYPLIDRFTNENLPYGALIAVDTSGRGAEPNIDDLGNRVKLIFVPADELQ